LSRVLTETFLPLSAWRPLTSGRKKVRVIGPTTLGGRKSPLPRTGGAPERADHSLEQSSPNCQPPRSAVDSKDSSTSIYPSALSTLAEVCGPSSSEKLPPAVTSFSQRFEPCEDRRVRAPQRKSGGSVINRSRLLDGFPLHLEVDGCVAIGRGDDGVVEPLTDRDDARGFPGASTRRTWTARSRAHVAQTGDIREAAIARQG
jgi:hypothetical protein